MPAGADRKREREYEQLVKEFKREGRYQGREAEVAARIVNQQRAQFGETKAARARDKGGEAHNPDLPIKGYLHLTVDQVLSRIGSLSLGELKKLKRYEQQHKNRKTLLAKIERAIK